MIDYQKRVTDERHELIVKLAKLNSFMGTPVFENLDINEQCDMDEQVLIMSRYIEILSRRINRFNGEHIKKETK